MSSEARRSELVVGVDGSVASNAAVSWAAHEATMRGLPIKLVHVVAPTLMSSTMAPNDTITQEQEDKALVVLGSRGRGGFDGLHLGSVSSAVAQSARVPVIVVRSGD